jgi:hypothetical protein
MFLCRLGILGRHFLSGGWRLEVRRRGMARPWLFRPEWRLSRTEGHFHTPKPNPVLYRAIVTTAAQVKKILAPREYRRIYPLRRTRTCLWPQLRTDVLGLCYDGQASFLVSGRQWIGPRKGGGHGCGTREDFPALPKLTESSAIASPGLLAR